MSDSAKPAWQCTATKSNGTPCVLPSGHHGYHQSPPFAVGRCVGFDLWKGSHQPSPQER